ncbi:23S rRNA pseudouridine(2604) synthase RluF [Massilibacteroides vaginae]|uniref:23S rRNA pseudouridine(2604) synthase RluF n=1 Tax=Massilibacteroides vaginae TaxID=1673718 RepID=UPI000A1C8753|nr:23S rRNA pseudouridine(2604) synthase RluF [Massilibacteroides vaginae]
MEYRLNKYISASGYCSRREADRFIESGNVTVNGIRAAIGARVLPGQKVRVNGNLISHEIEPIYIAFNKPVGVVSTTDRTDKNNIIDFISHEQRIFPIGRLDKDSQGLILLTNDGDIVNKILRAGNNHKKEYVVTVNRPITKEFLTQMAAGVPILDRVTRRCELEEVNPYTFKISLIQGLNRQIRRMCEYFNYEVTKLERTQIMNIKLGKLGQGNTRELTLTELEELFDLLEKSDNKAEVSKPKAQVKKSSRPPKGKTIPDYTKPPKHHAAPKEARGEENTDKKKDSRVKATSKKSKSSGPRIGKQRPDKVKQRQMSDFEKYKYKRNKKKGEE